MAATIIIISLLDHAILIFLEFLHVKGIHGLIPLRIQDNVLDSITIHVMKLELRRLRSNSGRPARPGKGARVSLGLRNKEDSLKKEDTNKREGAKWGERCVWCEMWLVFGLNVQKLNNHHYYDLHLLVPVYRQYPSSRCHQCHRGHRQSDDNPRTSPFHWPHN